MNKKSLMGLALAAVVTLSSTSVIVFASQNTEKSTRNVVKVASSNVKANKSGSEVDAQNKNISDDQAIQIAKKALKDYLGVDIEAKIKTDGLKSTVNGSRDRIMVSFQKGNDQKEMPEASVEIVKKDGKARLVIWRGNRENGENKEYSYDAAKVKQLAENYLKKMGLDKGIKSVTAGDQMKYRGIFTAECSYTDGSTIDLDFYGKDYSLVSYVKLDKPVKLDAKSQNSNISDEKATQIAKDALKNYLGVDIEQKVKDQNLKTSVMRFDNDIMISFDLSFEQAVEERNKNMAADNNSVIISAKDGSVSSLCGMNGLYENQNYQCDESKLKEAAQKFLKDKGLRTDVQSFKLGEDKKALSLASLDCEYADGSKVSFEFYIKDYSVVYVSLDGTCR